MSAVKDVPETGNCFRCGIELGPEFYCYGCREFICEGDDCGGMVAWSLASAMGHGHEPEAHWVEADEE